MRLVAVLTVLTAFAATASAQVTPAAGYVPPDDTPSIRIGVTLFGDYTYTQSPQVPDADGNLINPSEFSVRRSYINITGNISHLIAFRITPDVARETSSSLSGSLEFRIKYAFAQFNLDDWITKGSWARIGIQQTPWVDFEEGIYRYRFQGTVFSEREGYLSSSDGGASFHYNSPNNYADVHVGVYNGENYNKAEVNDQKAFQIRASVRPLARGPLAWRGLRGHVFYDADHYVQNADRKRFVGSVTFEHTFLHAGVDYLKATDQTSITKPEGTGTGYSIWATPRSPKGWEGLLRFDHLTPNTISDVQTRNRSIVGVAYWFPHQGNVSTALLLDYDGQTFENVTPAIPAQRKIAVHALVNF